MFIHRTSVLTVVLTAISSYCQSQTLEKPNQVVSAVAPTYPAPGYRFGVSGAVEVRVKISVDGRVTEAIALTGPQQLRQSAEAAAREWLFVKAEDGSDRSIVLNFEFIGRSTEPNLFRVKFHYPSRVEIAAEKEAINILADPPVNAEPRKKKR